MIVGRKEGRGSSNGVESRDLPLQKGGTNFVLPELLFLIK